MASNFRPFFKILFSEFQRKNPGPQTTSWMRLKWASQSCKLGSKWIQVPDRKPGPRAGPAGPEPECIWPHLPGGSLNGLLSPRYMGRLCPPGSGLWASKSSQLGAAVRTAAEGCFPPLPPLDSHPKRPPHFGIGSQSLFCVCIVPVWWQGQEG